jgi:Rrf2 family iron-sulfur cluster assembly transcriptional regulator
LTHELWSDLSQQIFTFLSGITLAQFVERSSVQEVAKKQDALHQRKLITEESAAI